MRIVSAEAITEALDPANLREALRAAFQTEIAVPLRHQHGLLRSDGDASLLLMPAWQEAVTQGSLSAVGHIGIKVVTVFPGNAARGLATVQAVYLLLAGDSGLPLAVMDGQTLTLWRTAAASALAADYLARSDAGHLLMIGAGALAPHLIAAHVGVRPIRRVSIWNRSRAAAEALVKRLDGKGYTVRLAENLDSALQDADIVSSATLAALPLIKGALLKPGCHVDLVGGFTPAMREADDDAIRRATLYVDTRAGALHEAGDIVQPIADGLITPDDIAGDLFDLTRGTVAGRRTVDEITLFKSVGTALEDLAAAAHIWHRIG